MAPKLYCKLCMNMPKRNGITKIDSLPKTFTIILEQMSGYKFSKDDLADMVICLKCLHFLKNMDNSSTQTKSSNKISEEGKKRVFRLMEKKRVPAAEAIEIVLAEQRANELLIESGIKPNEGKDNILQGDKGLKKIPDPNSLKIPRLSGAQRKKAGILMDAGMDPQAARQLIYAAKVANAAANMANANAKAQMSANMQGPAGQRKPGNQIAQRAGGQKNNLPQGRAAQIGVARPAQTGRAKAVQNTPVQRVAPVKSVVPQKAGPGPKGPNQRGAPSQKVVPNQKGAAIKKPSTISPGILVPQTRRQNNNAGGGRVGAVVGPRRNERPAPYNTNQRQQNQNQARQQNQNQSRQQNQSQQQNTNFNQQQRQQNSSYEVGIVPINYPNEMLDNLKLDALKEAITNEILKIPQGGPLIRFLGTSAQDGWLKIICADQLSYNWLASLVSRWERAGVRMVEGNNMPETAILSFYLQGDFRSPDEILSIIEKQNNGLNANQWRVMNRESDGNGQLISVCVNERCFQALQSRDFMVFLGLGVVELKPKRSNSDNDLFNQNSSSQNFSLDGNGNFGFNNMQGGGNFNLGNDNYNRSMDSGRSNGNNYQNQGIGQGYQRGGGYQNQRVW